MNVQTVIDYARKIVKEKPQLRSQVDELVQLMHDEIEAGESSANEAQICYSNLVELENEAL